VKLDTERRKSRGRIKILHQGPAEATFLLRGGNDLVGKKAKRGQARVNTPKKTRQKVGGTERGVFTEYRLRFSKKTEK